MHNLTPPPPLTLLSTQSPRNENWEFSFYRHSSFSTLPSTLFLLYILIIAFLIQSIGMFQYNSIISFRLSTSPYPLPLLSFHRIVHLELSYFWHSSFPTLPATPFLLNILIITFLIQAIWMFCDNSFHSAWVLAPFSLPLSPIIALELCTEILLTIGIAAFPLCLQLLSYLMFS